MARAPRHASGTLPAVPGPGVGKPAETSQASLPPRGVPTHARHSSGMHPAAPRAPESPAAEGGPESSGTLDMRALIAQLELHRDELLQQNDELRGTQVALEESRDRYAQLFDLAPVAFLEITDRSTILEANDAAATLLELPKDRLKRASFLRLLPVTQRAPFLTVRQTALESGAPQAWETSLARADGSTVAVLAEVAAQRSRGRTTFLCACVDISRLKMTETALSEVARAFEEANARLRELAMNDPLTSLLNRRGFEHGLAVEMERARRNGSRLFAILIDCDDFKAVNDMHGHAAGDVALATVARRLKEVLRPSDHLARIGGDEFLALLPDVKLGHARDVAERLRLAVAAEPLAIQDGLVRMTLSIAVGDVDRTSGSIEDILATTRGALKTSKSRGKNRVTIAPALEGETAPDAALVRGLAHALRSSTFLTTVAQPIVRVEDGRMIAVELLTRGPAGPVRHPSDLFRLAMEEGALGALDIACLRACIAGSRVLPTHLMRHVNLHPSTLLAADDAALADIISLFDAAGPGAKFCIELSEQSLAGEPAAIRHQVAQLRASGLTIALEDVGFGRTSLEGLILLEPEVVKIDRSLVRGVAGDSAKARALRRLVSVAHALRATTLAEGVESAEDLNLLRHLGVTLAQGFHLGAPAPLAAVRSVPVSP